MTDRIEAAKKIAKFEQSFPGTVEVLNTQLTRALHKQFGIDLMDEHNKYIVDMIAQIDGIVERVGSEDKGIATGSALLMMLSAIIQYTVMRELQFSYDATKEQAPESVSPNVVSLAAIAIATTVILEKRDALMKHVGACVNNYMTAVIEINEKNFV